MSKYLIIESRDPFETRDVTHAYDLAINLGKEGHDVAFFLVQNAVFAARLDAQPELFKELVNQTHVTVYVDDYSLDERGIQGNDLKKDITLSNMSELVDFTMEEGRKPIWH